MKNNNITPFFCFLVFKKKTKRYVQNNNKSWWNTMIMLEYEEITKKIVNDNTILICGGILYCRAPKQSRSRKMIPAKQYATKLLRKGHGIGIGGYSQVGWQIQIFLIWQSPTSS